MASFRSDNQNALLEHSPIPKSDQADYHEWSKRFARASIDEWADQQPDKPSRSEALRRPASTALASQEPVATAAPFVGLRLPAELLDVVDAWAASKNLTRPRAIRALIDAGVVASIPHTKLRPISDASEAAKPTRKKSR